MDQAVQLDSRLPSLEDALHLGQSLHLEFEETPEANGCYQLWGLCPASSIMVSAVQLEKLPALPPQKVKARLFIDQLNQACGFRTELTSSVEQPTPYLHLEMPERVLMGQTRRNYRVNMKLPAGLVLNNEAIKAEVIDASLSGCRLKTHNIDLKVGESIAMHFDVSVFGITERIEVTSVVRSRAESNGNLYVGVQFEQLNDHQRITLHSYLANKRAV